MRPGFLTVLSLLLTLAGFAQAPSRRAKPIIYSAYSEWQRITLKPTTRLSSGPTTPGQAAPSEPARQSASPQNGNESVVQTKPTTNSVPTPSSSPATQPTEPVNRPVVPNESATLSNRASASPVGSAGFRPAFTGDFATNRNGWKAGNKGDYHYQIGLGRYSIRKRNANTRQTAFTYVALPPDINLNQADTFTIKVDVLADSGRIPDGGLLFGVRDSLNFCAFRMSGRGEVSIIRVVNGQPFPDYMPGDFFTPGIPIDRNRNRLIVRRRRDALHFYINEREVRSSPYPFKVLPGNGIGLTSSAYWTTFQRLSVTLGP